MLTGRLPVVETESPVIVWIQGVGCVRAVEVDVQLERGGEDWAGELQLVADAVQVAAAVSVWNKESWA